ncbi:hypothetical protein [Hirschia maritima]|uniref:hypothetical protein n=1 Tax=Hirschia maritima TaxID=1121961 RepID=UPI0003737450|nr:hypothetical protein [Hirschia maritima]
MKLILREATAPTLALFATTSTLLCCALPALLITLGAGAVMAGLTSSIPGIIWLTEHKLILFGVSGALLIAAVVTKWMTRHAPCPIDPKLAKACAFWRRTGSIILATASVFYLVGAFFAFFAADLLL